MDRSLKRISILIREDQYTLMNQRGLNISGLIRDLIDDYFSEHKITISVEEKTRNLYDQIISNTGSTDADLELFFQQALRELLDAKISNMQKLRSQLEDQTS